MAPDRSRRSLVAAVLAGGIATSIGGYGWLEYSRRNHLDLRLTVENRSDEAVKLSVVVFENGDILYERTDNPYCIEGRADDDSVHERHIAGPWIKYQGQYSLQLSAVNESLKLTNTKIIDRLGSDSWGSKAVNVVIVITEDRTLETNVLSQMPSHG